MSWFEKFLSITRLQWTQRFSVMLLIGVVPVVMMWHVLFVDQAVHLANPGPLPFASAVTDLDGAARFAYLLSDMTYPWSNTTFISSPVGASIWRLETFSQLLQTLFLWLSVKVVSPMLAANLLVFLGWYGTGVVVYLIYRRCGGSKLIALACVVAVQLLPAMRFMAANFTSYVAIGVPLLVVLATLIYFQSKTLKNGLLIAIAFIINALYDPYWFMFSVFGATLTIFLMSARRAIKSRSIPAIGVAVGVVSIYLATFQVLSSFLTLRTTSGNSREITSGDVSWIRSSLLSVDKWGDSVYMGVGIITLGLFILVSIVFIAFRGKFNNESLILIFMAGYVLLSTSITIPLNSGKIEFAVYIRNFMPGVRFFDRAALIAGPLLLIFLCLVTEKSVALMQLHRRRILPLMAVIIVLLPLSYPGLSIANSTNSYNDWREIRNQLGLVQNPKVLAIPFNRVGRDWIEQASFQVPLLNDYTSNINDLEITRQMSHGPVAFASHVSNLGGTHVLVARTDLLEPLRFELVLPYFKKIGSILLDGYSEGPFMYLDAYEIIPPPGNSVCSNCSMGEYLESELAVVGDYVNPPDIHTDGTMSWWISGDVTKISLFSLGKNVTSLYSRIDFNISIAPCLETQEVVVYIGSREIKEKLGTTQTTFSFSVDGSEVSDGITIRTLGSSCLIETDPRPLKIQLSGLNAR